MSTTFIFTAKNSSITIIISAENEEDAKAEIGEYFDDYGTEYLKNLNEDDE